MTTHDIDEALHLCDRILVLRGQPGVLAREVPLTVGLPRQGGDAELGRLKGQILEILDLGALQPPRARIPGVGRTLHE